VVKQAALALTYSSSGDKLMSGGVVFMNDTCMFDIMALPEESLKKALPKVSVRMISRLVTAYPRAIGRTMLTILSQTMSPMTLEFLMEEMNNARLPTIEQIREAEREFIKTIYDEHLQHELLNARKNSDSLMI
jgi:hypothetical protein